MAKSKSKNVIGGWAFLIGVILAIILGLIGTMSPGLIYLFVIIGIIIGLLNIADEEAKPFMISSVVLLLASYFGSNVISSVPLFQNVLNALLYIFVPSTIVVAIRNVLSLARR